MTTMMMECQSSNVLCLSFVLLYSSPLFCSTTLQMMHPVTSNGLHPPILLTTSRSPIACHLWHIELGVVVDGAARYKKYTTHLTFWVFECGSAAGEVSPSWLGKSLRLSFEEDFSTMPSSQPRTILAHATMIPNGKMNGMLLHLVVTRC